MEINDTFELLPNAKMLLSSLRSVGYTEETAIADIVDNSISSGATKIQLYFDWDEKRILIADNGRGMNKDELLESMKIGSADPAEMRNQNDLGRFGMGMKTASFSIGKKLLVITKQDNIMNNSEWNLDHVEQNNKWEVLIHSDNEIEDYLESIQEQMDFNEWEQGTIISLSVLDRLIDYNNLEKSKKKFYKTIKNIRAHLAMIFHRFIEEEELELSINKNVLQAWNPFVRQNPATMELSKEELFDGKSEVYIEPFILPHKNKFGNEEEYKKAGGPKEWLGQQGFYVYRNRRLIVYGTWFGKFKKEPAYNLARIRLDMNSESDFEWGIDIKKSKATLPVAIEESITQIAYLAVERSVAVYNSRGVYNRKNTSNNTSLKYVWEQRRNAVGNYMFYLNKKHPMLLKLMQELDDETKKELKTYLSLVENYSPAMLSGVIAGDDMATVADDIKAKDILNLKEKIAILKDLQYESEEIYEVLAESPEYAYLKNELNTIIGEN
ncbi:ATP-binding protein [Anaerobium acetethylicum]|uniref:Histidine kinase-, DNA gyrase B-, and HSP90-like ATPase n=1 Tax=Anaerobium acetethylicum TaxID=1619234 RepID=A0A1D3TWI3_9FIRM|nr:ATP-binding protein [Anaerobium acetethylicum]SCP98598.1 Histidine kinase-, DNA gyrase B-, and HSP90-like ATPase [Anaerobium acetethylicum]